MAEELDGTLVERTRRGDAEAYGLLVARYQGHVYGLAYSLVGRWEDAQDVAQEAFIRAYLNLDQLREPAHFASWLRRVAFSVSMNWLRAWRPEAFARLAGKVDLDILEIPDFTPGPPEVLARKELAEAVRRAVESLPPKYRVPLTMFHLDGLSYQKVADFLDIPLGTAQSLLHRAREKLKAALGSWYGEEITPMVQEVFQEHKLPEAFRHELLDEVTNAWWGGLAQAHEANEATREQERAVLEEMRASLGEVPEWATHLGAALPDWGLEPCAHRWVEALDHLLQSIGTDSFSPSPVGRCGDIPSSVTAEMERLLQAAQRWLQGAMPRDDGEAQVFGRLGDPTPGKEEAVHCFIASVKACLQQTSESVKEVGQQWRTRVVSRPLLQRMFYGDGIDGGLENACGYAAVDRLGIYLRVIGGDDSRLVETRWVCNAQLHDVMRDDPERMWTTLGYLWGTQAYLLEEDEAWLQAKPAPVHAAARHALTALRHGGASTPLRRWLAASFFSATRFWYQRARNFTGTEAADARLEAPGLRLSCRGEKESP